MHLKNTFFKKYFLVNIIVILVSFITTGIIVTGFMSGFWEEHKCSLLDENVESIALFIKRTLKDNQTELDTIDNDLTKNVLDTFSNNIDADVFITDENGVIMLLSQRAKDHLSLNQSIPSYIVDDALDDGYNGKGNLGGVYDDNCYFVGSPISIDIDGKSTQIGIVFTATDTSYIKVFRMHVLKIFLLAGVSSFAVAFLLFGMLSYSMTRPLKQLSKAAHDFGKGNLKSRVAIKDQDEIGNLSREFNDMADSIEESEIVRRNFISNVSHELKTPMTSICGFVDAILDGTIPQEEQKHYLMIVSDEAKRLSRLVSSMLNLSRIDSDKIKLNKQEFDITQSTIAILFLFKSKIEDKNVDVIGIDSLKKVMVCADKDMITQVIYNLIENACKFVEQNGFISIKIKEEGNIIIFTIKNSGKGINKDEIRLVFDKFYKADKSRSNNKSGLGLGLYIAKTIINRHKGEISLNSDGSQYCEFEFWIPKK